MKKSVLKVIAVALTSLVILFFTTGCEKKDSGESASQAEQTEASTDVSGLQEYVTMEGSVVARYGLMEGKLVCYEEGIAKLYITYASNTREMEGTWEMDDASSMMTISIMDGTHDVPKADDGTYSFGLPVFDGEGNVTISFAQK